MGMKPLRAPRQKSVGGLSATSLVVLFYMWVIAGVILAGGCALADTGKDKRMTKISHDLVVLYDEYVVYQKKSENTAFTPSNPLVRISQGRVLIDAVASGDVEALRTDLDALGLLQGATFGRMVSGRLPIEAIDDLADLASLQFARPAYAKTHSGFRHPSGPSRPTAPPLEQK